MAGRHSDNDGSDIFWPGYVDATTNLILNLLFLLTILIVAVFMFALELGRTSKIEPGITLTAPSKHEKVIDAESTIDYAKENVALKREVQRLQELLEQREDQKQQPRLVKNFAVKNKASRTQTGLNKIIAGDFELKVRFKDDAITFTQQEHDRLIKVLKPILSHEKTGIYVEVPAGFSEAKRLGFYRAMAVRNLLLEMNKPKENIDVAVTEGAENANASVVRVVAKQ